MQHIHGARYMCGRCSPSDLVHPKCKDTRYDGWFWYLSCSPTAGEQGHAHWQWHLAFNLRVYVTSHIISPMPGFCMASALCSRSASLVRLTTLLMRPSGLLKAGKYRFPECDFVDSYLDGCLMVRCLQSNLRWAKALIGKRLIMRLMMQHLNWSALNLLVGCGTYTHAIIMFSISALWQITHLQLCMALGEDSKSKSVQVTR